MITSMCVTLFIFNKVMYLLRNEDSVPFKFHFKMTIPEFELSDQRI